MIYYSDTFLTFLDQSTAHLAAVLRNAYTKKFNAYQLLLTSQYANYLDVSNGSISYLPANSPDINLPWSSNKRKYGKPGRVVRKLFTNRALDIMTDYLFEEFTNSFKASTAVVQMSLLDAADIPLVYDSAIAEGDGTLNNSCMNKYGYYLQLYAKCSQVKILIAKNAEGTLCGRALVWTIGADTLMDRIYVNEDHLYEIFISYAMQNQWWYKVSYDSRRDKDLFYHPNGNAVRKNFVINTPTDFQHYPYIDTFTFGGDGYLSNVLSGEFVYNNCSGSRSLRSFLTRNEKDDL